MDLIRNCMFYVVVSLSLIVCNCIEIRENSAVVSTPRLERASTKKRLRETKAVIEIGVTFHSFLPTQTPPKVERFLLVSFLDTQLTLFSSPCQAASFDL